MTTSGLERLVTRADRFPSLFFAGTTQQRLGCFYGQPMPNCGPVPACCLLSWLILAYTCPFPLQEFQLRRLPCNHPCLRPSLPLRDRLNYNSRFSLPLDTSQGTTDLSPQPGGSTTLTLTPSGTGTGPLSCTHAPRYGCTTSPP